MNEIDTLKNESGIITKENIIKVIPYQEPFLFVDEITYLDAKRITATKKVKKDEFWEKSHFVDFPIMPGALIIEGLGQAATFLVRYNLPKHEEKDILAYKIKSVKFLYPAFPGDNLKFEIKLLRIRQKGAVLKCVAFTNDKECSRAKIIVAIVDKTRFRNKFLLKGKN